MIGVLIIAASLACCGVCALIREIVWERAKPGHSYRGFFIRSRNDTERLRTIEAIDTIRTVLERWPEYAAALGREVWIVWYAADAAMLGKSDYAGIVQPRRKWPWSTRIYVIHVRERPPFGVASTALFHEYAEHVVADAVFGDADAAHALPLEKLTQELRATHEARP